MSVAHRLVEKNVCPSVVTNSVLVARRMRELQRRRGRLVAQQEQLRGQLPDWAVEPLRLAGLTREEIGRRVDAWASAEASSGLPEVDQEIEAIDQQLEQLEELLLRVPSQSLDEIEAVLTLATGRLREMIVTDPSDVFYDHGEARALVLVERVREDLERLLSRARLEAG